jgi:adenosylmethionine-8-amino-7-oxononanoate aminotransferase
MERGLLIRPLGNVMYVLPPYCIADEDLHRAYDGIEVAVQTIL